MNQRIRNPLIVIFLLVILPYSCAWISCGERSDDYIDNFKKNETFIIKTPPLDVSIKYCYFFPHSMSIESSKQEQHKYNSSIRFHNNTKNIDIFIKKIDVKYISDNFEIPYKKYLAWNVNQKAIPFDRYDNIENKFKIIPGILESKYWNSDLVYIHDKRFSFVFDEDMRKYKNFIIDVNIIIIFDKEEFTISKKIPVTISRGYELVCDD